MTNISVMEANTFAMEMTREALAHPLVTPWHREIAWRHFDIVSNNAPAATITIRRHGELMDIITHCEMEYDGPNVVRGTIELIIGDKTWQFTCTLTATRTLLIWA
jgi:hypothetical protein